MANMTAALRGQGEFVIVPAPNGQARDGINRFYHLRRKDGLFPLASGPIGFIRKNFCRLTMGAYLDLAKANQIAEAA